MNSHTVSMICLHLCLLWVALGPTTVYGQSCDTSLSATLVRANHTALVGSSGTCTWTITRYNDTYSPEWQEALGTEEFTVEVSFRDVNLSNHVTCDVTNSIVVYDGDTSGPILGLVCRDYFSTFQSTGRSITLQYPASEVTDASDFTLHYQQIKPGECDGPRVYAASSVDYNIYTPMYPTGTQESSKKCEWVIKAPQKTRVLLTIETSSTVCADVNITISEVTGSEKHTWCPGLENKVQFLDRFLIIEMDISRGQAVHIKYRALEVSPCLETLNATKEEKFITTPNYPSPYPSFTQCRWMLRNTDRESYNTIRVDVVDMDMEQSEDCRTDSLRIRNGMYRDPFIVNTCDGKNTSFYGYVNGAMVVFSSVSYPNTRRGIKLKYYLGSAEPCGGNLTANSSIQSIQSPGYPYVYPNSVKCVWTITPSNPNNFVRIEFVVLEIFTAFPSCYGDYVSIFDGSTESAFLLGKVCGDVGSTVFEGAGESITVVFKSDDSYDEEGFKMTYEETEEPPILNRQIEVNRDEATLTSPRYPNGQVRNVNSTWTLRPRYGSYQIMLTFTDVDIGDVDDCSNNYIKVFNGNTSSSQSSTLCGKETEVYLSRDSLLTVFMKSDNIPTTRGFQAKYSWLYDHDIPGCNGKPDVQSAYFSFDETIETPNYPNIYPNFANCSYVIEAFSGNYYLRVNIVDAEFADTTNCTKDYIEIFDGDTTDATSLGRICGSTTKTIESTGTRMLIRFISDSKLGAKGAKISFKAVWIESSYPNYLWVIILVCVLGGLVIVCFVVCYIWRKRKSRGAAAI